MPIGLAVPLAGPLGRGVREEQGTTACSLRR